MQAKTQSVADLQELRRSLGMFATGVAVVTTLDADRKPVGLTINSFNSVSLEPALIVWSLSRHLICVPAFEDCDYYAINILSQAQQPVSQHFASKSRHKFAHLAYENGLGDVPLLADCCAWFEVRNRIRHDGGDHILFLGEVERYRRTQLEPLIFFGGTYRQLAP